MHMDGHILSKNEMWQTVQDALEQDAITVKRTVHRSFHQVQTEYEVPIIGHLIFEKDDDHSEHPISKPHQKQFMKMGGKLYDPQILYSLVQNTLKPLGPLTMPEPPFCSVDEGKAKVYQLPCKIFDLRSHKPRPESYLAHSRMNARSTNTDPIACYCEDGYGTSDIICQSGVVIDLLTPKRITHIGLAVSDSTVFIAMNTSLIYSYAGRIAIHLSFPFTKHLHIKRQAPAPKTQ